MSWDFPFLFWGDANGKFTYVPKYKPEISKLDYTNRHLSNSITFPVNISRADCLKVRSSTGNGLG